MSKWTDQLPEAAREYIGNRRVDEVECVIGDIAGVARGKAMPAAKFAKQTNYFLPNSIFLQTITGEWADNPFDAFTEPDMILEPDWSTATAAPWTADVTLQVIHDAEHAAVPRGHRLEEPDPMLEPRIEGADARLVAVEELSVEPHDHRTSLSPPR